MANRGGTSTTLNTHEVAICQLVAKLRSGGGGRYEEILPQVKAEAALCKSVGTYWRVIDVDGGDERGQVIIGLPEYGYKVEIKLAAKPNHRLRIAAADDRSNIYALAHVDGADVTFLGFYCPAYMGLVDSWIFDNDGQPVHAVPQDRLQSLDWVIREMCEGRVIAE